MTQFDLRFQDLLRHSDWRVEPCHVWIGSSGEWASGESHQRVIHRADPALYVIPRLLNSIISPKLRSFATWTERRQLVKFAREVVRLDGLSAAWKVKETETEIAATVAVAAKETEDNRYSTRSSNRKEDGIVIYHYPNTGPLGSYKIFDRGNHYMVPVIELERFRFR